MVLAFWILCKTPGNSWYFSAGEISGVYIPIMEFLIAIQILDLHMLMTFTRAVPIPSARILFLRKISQFPIVR